MIKRKYSILMVLGIILISLSFQNLTFVTGIDISITDPEDDVIKDFFYPGDYFDEIDIIKLEVNGQITNLTVAGALIDWGGYYYAEQKSGQVIILEDFDMDLYKKTGNFSYPYYSVSYQNWTSSIDDFDVFFVKYIDEYSEEYWTGSGYSTSEASAQSIGYGSGSSIIGNVSNTDYIIPDNATIFALTTCVTLEVIDTTIYIHFYFDFAPDEFYFNPFSTGGDDAIPGYDLFIFIGALFGISIYVVIKRRKRK